MKKILLNILVALFTLSMALCAFSESYPQRYGETGNTIGSSASVLVSASKMTANVGDEVTFSVRFHEVDKPFTSLLVIPVYDTEVFEMKTENGELYQGLITSSSIPTPSLSSQSFTEKSAAGSEINAFDCVYAWNEAITVDGNIFKFTLKSFAAPESGESTKVGVYLKAANGELYYADFDSVEITVKGGGETSEPTATPTPIIMNTPEVTATAKPTDTPTDNETDVPTETPGSETAVSTETAESVVTPTDKPTEKATEKPAEKSGCGSSVSALPVFVAAACFLLLTLNLHKYCKKD